MDLYEVVSTELGYPVRIHYSYTYLQGEQRVFRYDNAPHHPNVVTFPHHKHIGPQDRLAGQITSFGRSDSHHWWNDLPTVITSNWTEPELAFYHGRIASRLKAARHVHSVAPDVRGGIENGEVSGLHTCE